MEKTGFSLLELVIVLAIIGLLTVMIVPTLRKPSQVRPKDFVARLNTLMQSAWQQALTTNRVQKILFDFANKKITLQERLESGKTGGPEKFVPITSGAFVTTLALPAGYNFNNFYIEKKDQMRIAGERTTAWFFLVPDGTAQEVIINGSDRGEEESTRTVETRGVERFSFVLNPFSAQFTYYDTFQTP